MAYNNQYPGYTAPAPSGQQVTTQKSPTEQAMADAIKAAMEAEQKKTEKYKQDMAAQGLLPDGSPMRPEYQSLLDPATGMMKTQYNMNPNKIDANSLEGMAAMKNMALGQGPSQWAQLMMQQQGMQEAGQKDQAATQAASGAAQARGAMAMRGGISSGARERLAGGSARDLLFAKQGIANQGNQSRLGINIEDQSQRNKMLSQFSEGEAKLAGYNNDLSNKAQQYNIEGALTEKRAKDAQDLTVYQEQLKKWAAEKQADATAKSGGGGGGGGCFITTAVCEGLGMGDNNIILNTFRKFRDDFMGGKNSAELKEYYRIAPLIVPHIAGKKEVLAEILSGYLLPAYGALREGRAKDAHDLYKQMVINLKKTYSIEEEN